MLTFGGGLCCRWVFLPVLKILRRSADVVVNWVSMVELTIRKVCPDFDEWPDSWEGVPEDLNYGRELLAIFEPFCED